MIVCDFPHRIPELHRKFIELFGLYVDSLELRLNFFAKRNELRRIEYAYGLIRFEKLFFDRHVLLDFGQHGFDVLAVTAFEPPLFRHLFVYLFSRTAGFVDVDPRKSFLRDDEKFGDHDARIFYDVFDDVFAVFHFFRQDDFLFGGE